MTFLEQPFQRATNAKDVSKTLIRLTAAFGEPYRNDDKLVQLMQAEWIRALDGKSAKTIEMATDYWIATKTKWPKVAEIVELADGYMQQQVAGVSEQRGLHPARVKLPALYHGFTLRKSPLRSNLTWYRWLDTRHPMVEHSYFADAKFSEYEHIIIVQSAFVRDYIQTKYAENLKAHFHRTVYVRVGK